ncbi:MAG: hypothetical protein JWM56_288 [Candidatus Peribacteria bacterium]|nr:hypothetical protein [Candidatus Peribacteria bacterium]
MWRILIFISIVTPSYMATRKIADCRTMPSTKNCSLTIAGTEEEVLTVATRHAIEEHGHKDTPELREEVRSTLQDEK